MRLDAFLAKEYPNTSRATFQKLVAAGDVQVNGEVVTDVRKNIGDEDRVTIKFPDKKTFTNEIKAFADHVIYEDENIIVVNKPAGMLTHAKGEMNDEFTVADYVRSRIVPGEFAESNRPGIVHRLDRATSGILIAAKNPDTMKLLTSQFADRKAHKTYLALVEQVPKLTEAKIDLPIARNPKKPAEFRVDTRGKSAITDYEVLETYDDNSASIELRPLTGRTHQLRVHLAHIGAPIVGDEVYNERLAKKLAKHPELREQNYMLLHAAKLEITIPKTGRQTENQRRIFEAPLPDYFDEATKHRGKRGSK